MTLGDLIKEYRTNEKLSMDEFAKKSGLSKAYVGLLEKNKHPRTGKPISPSIEIIKKVSDAIEKDFDEVFNKIDGNVKLSGKIPSNNPPPLPEGAIPYVPEPMVNVPLVGSVNCGTPLFAEDNIEGYIPTPESDLQTGETYFWLRAKGDSMINAGIHHGDLLLIRQQADVDNGDIAVVAVNGDEATLKRVKKQENALILQPENPACEPKIFVGKDMENIHIRGRLMQLRKEF